MFARNSLLGKKLFPHGKSLKNQIKTYNSNARVGNSSALTKFLITNPIRLFLVEILGFPPKKQKKSLIWRIIIGQKEEKNQQIP